MKSRITIEVDFDNNTPVIQIDKKWSEDVRDKILNEFFKKLGYSSSWFRLLSIYTNDEAEMWHIIPIQPKELPEQSELIQERLRSGETVQSKEEISIFPGESKADAMINHLGMDIEENDLFFTYLLSNLPQKLTIQQYKEFQENRDYE